MFSHVCQFKSFDRKGTFRQVEYMNILSAVEVPLDKSLNPKLKRQEISPLWLCETAYEASLKIDCIPSKQ